MKKEKENLKVEKELMINLDSDSFKDQKERLIKEFGVSSSKADEILELVKKYILISLEKANKTEWSEEVKDAFINVMTSVFIGISLAIEKEK